MYLASYDLIFDSKQMPKFSGYEVNYIGAS